MSELVTHPSPVLRKPAEDWEYNKEEAHALRDLLHAVMKKHKGIGIAAPQIGMSIRVCLVQDELLINPRIVARSGVPLNSDEGCLSCPGHTVRKRRKYGVTVQYTDIEGKQVEKRFREKPACIVQHEVDHLNGVLIIDV